MIALPSLNALLVQADTTMLLIICSLYWLYQVLYYGTSTFEILVDQHEPTLGQRLEAGYVLSGLSIDTCAIKSPHFFTTWAFPVEDLSLCGASLSSDPSQSLIPSTIEDESRSGYAQRSMSFKVRLVFWVPNYLNRLPAAFSQ